MTITTGVPAGWYGDPQEPISSLRYWNGSAWTEHVAPRAQVAPSPQGYSFPGQGWPQQPPAPYGSAPGMGEEPSDVMHWVVPTGRSWQTIASGYLGLISLFTFFPGPFAIVLGVLGLRAASQQGSHGRIRAIFGIVSGSIGTFIAIVVVISLFQGPV
jgi:hypothetical protein